MKVFFIFLFHLCCIFIFSVSAFAQKEATNWFFGRVIGLNFSNGYPIQSYGNQSISFSGQNTSTISDKEGNLLFYSDGYNIYDKHNHVMPSANPTNHTSFTIIVPKPGSDNLFYLFLADQSLYTPGLRYSIIDMNLNGGMGDVTVQNQLISSAVTWMFTTVKHQNKKDVWLIAHERNSNKFLSYLITSAGISSPIVSSIGNVYPGNNYYPYNSNIQSFKASPDGKKLVLIFTSDFAEIDTLDIFNFNDLTGNISNWISLNNFTIPLSVEFSPDGKKIYVSDYINLLMYQLPHGRLSQIDLSSNNPALIEKSITTVSVCSYRFNISTLQLGPDGKIYTSTYMNGSLIGTINDPNELGAACYYHDSVKYLLQVPGWPGSGTNGALTNFISSYFQPKFTYTHTCVTDSTTFTIADTSGVATISWEFGDPGSGTFNTSSDFNPKHKFSSKGDFNVKITFFFKDGSSEFYYYNVYIKDHLTQIDIGKDSILCKGQSLALNPCYQGVSYLWSDGSGNPYYTATSADTVWLEISNACNAVRDTIILKFQEPPPVNLGKDTTLCYDIFPNFFLNATTSGATYKWKDGSTSPTLQVQNAQTYWVDVTVGVCTVRDSIQFYATSPAPVLHLGNDTLLCEKDTLQLNVFNQDANYLWQDGSTSPSYEVSKPDTISTTVTIGACIRKDTIVVTYKPLPVLSLGNDTIVCPGTQVLLDVSTPGYTYKWKDGSSLFSYSVTSKDTVWVEATLNGCHKSDSIFVNYIKAPVVHFGNDTTLCTGEQLQLSVLSEQTSYLWNNGSTNAFRSITSPEKIWAQAQNKCGSATDTLLVSFLSPPVFSIGGDTILCFHDTLYLTLPSKNYTYKWQDGSSKTTYSITAAGTYHVTATNQCGSFTANKNITNISCCTPYIPNLLTDNNDGLNETLVISCIEDGQWKLEIFNRWGDRVFQSNDYHNELNGQQLEEGIYYYALSKQGKPSYKGWLQIVK